MGDKEWWKLWTDRDLWQAGRTGDVEQFKTLLSKACDALAKASPSSQLKPFDDQRPEGTLLHYAARFDWSNDIIEAIASSPPFVSVGIDVLNARLKQTALQRACVHGNVKSAETLIKLGSNVTLMTEEGSSMLHLAARGGSIPLFNLLLQELENKTGKTRDELLETRNTLNGGTPLFAAVKRGRLKVVEHLLRLGAHASTRDADQNTLLHILAQIGMTHSSERERAGLARNELFTTRDREVAQLLIKSGDVDVNAVNFYGATCLHYAVFHGRRDLIDLFKKQGVAGTIKDNDGNTAADLENSRGRRYGRTRWKETSGDEPRPERRRPVLRRTRPAGQRRWNTGERRVTFADVDEGAGSGSNRSSAKTQAKRTAGGDEGNASKKADPEPPKEERQENAGRRKTNTGKKGKDGNGHLTSVAELQAEIKAMREQLAEHQRETKDNFRKLTNQLIELEERLGS